MIGVGGGFLPWERLLVNQDSFRTSLANLGWLLPSLSNSPTSSEVCALRCEMSLLMLKADFDMAVVWWWAIFDARRSGKQTRD
jgi:hypothetical protein